jgi:hypothetical protein
LIDFNPVVREGLQATLGHSKGHRQAAIAAQAASWVILSFPLLKPNWSYGHSRSYCRKYSAKGDFAMSHDEKSTKLKYESPVIVPLGGMAKGSGTCNTGSAAFDTSVGNDGPYGATTCSTGTQPTDYCSPGTYADQTGSAYCSAGVHAANYCTAGTQASASASCKEGNSGAACNNGASA